MAGELFDIKVNYVVYSNITDPFVYGDVVTRGDMQTIAISDYDAENWVREFLEGKHPGTYVDVCAEHFDTLEVYRG